MTVEQRVKAPALGLLIFGALSVLMQLVGFVMQMFGKGFMQQFIDSASQSGQTLPSVFTGFGVGMQVGLGLVNLALSAFVCWGAVQMMKLRSHGLAQSVSVLPMVPCCVGGLCCIIGMPIGIWSLVVLNRPDVRSAFQANAAN